MVRGGRGRDLNTFPSSGLNAGVGCNRPLSSRLRRERPIQRPGHVSACLLYTSDITGISKSPAIFDIEKLTHFNALYLRAMTPEAFAATAEPYIRQAVKNPALDAAAIAALLQARCERLTDIPEKVAFFEALPEYDKDLFTNKKSKTNDEVARAMLEAAIPMLEALPSWNTDAIHDGLIALAERLEVKNATDVYKRQADHGPSHRSAYAGPRRR